MVERLLSAANRSSLTSFFTFLVVFMVRFDPFLEREIDQR